MTTKNGSSFQLLVMAFLLVLFGLTSCDVVSQLRPTLVPTIPAPPAPSWLLDIPFEAQLQCLQPNLQLNVKSHPPRPSGESNYPYPAMGQDVDIVYTCSVIKVQDYDWSSATGEWWILIQIESGSIGWISAEWIVAEDTS